MQSRKEPCWVASMKVFILYGHSSAGLLAG